MKEENIIESIKSLQDLLTTSPKRNLRFPLDKIVSKYVVNSSLSPTEQKVYLHFAIEFEIILNKSSSYQEALYKWNLILDDRLQEYGLTRSAWKIIEHQAMNDPKIKHQYDRLIIRIKHILKN